MAVVCCHKEYAEEYVILVCVDAPAPHNPDFYQRLRFGLLASSWLPSSLGIFLWSALHVMLLIVGGPVFWVLLLLTAFLFCSVFLFGILGIELFIIFVIFSLIKMAVQLVRLLGQSIRFCWSLVGFLACHEPIVEWTGGECCTPEFLKGFMPCPSKMKDMFWELLATGVPCMSDSLYRETKRRKLKSWARWFQEVVHVHDAIAL